MNDAIGGKVWRVESRAIAWVIFFIALIEYCTCKRRWREFADFHRSHDLEN